MQNKNCLPNFQVWRQSNLSIYAINPKKVKDSSCIQQNVNILKLFLFSFTEACESSASLLYEQKTHALQYK